MHLITLLSVLILMAVAMNAIPRNETKGDDDDNNNKKNNDNADELIDGGDINDTHMADPNIRIIRLTVSDSSPAEIDALIRRSFTTTRSVQIQNASHVQKDENLNPSSNVPIQNFQNQQQQHDQQQHEDKKQKNDTEDHDVGHRIKRFSRRRGLVSNIDA